MKHFIAIFLVTILATSCQQTAKEAVAYNDNIMDKLDDVFVALDDLVDSFSFFSDNSIDEQYQETLKVVEEIKAYAVSMEGFKESTTYKDAFVELMDVFSSGLKTEYPILIENLKIPAEDYAPEDEAQYNKVSQVVDDKFQNAQEKFIQAQEDFADKWGFKLIVEENVTQNNTK